jgi:hypothetical protein
MVSIQPYFSEDEALAALNVEPPGPASYGSFLKKYWRAAYVCYDDEWMIRDYRAGIIANVGLREFEEMAKTSLGRGQGSVFASNYLATATTLSNLGLVARWRGSSLPETISDQEGTLIAAALTSAYLRTFVDAWLETGRDANGTETPANRDLAKAPLAVHVVTEYLEACPPSLSPALDRNGFRLLVAQRDLQKPRDKNFFDLQYAHAKRIFVAIMASFWNERLCKCRYPLCGRYFTRLKPPSSYEHGTFCCREHGARASAKALTSARRSAVTGELITFAARQLGKWHVSADWQDNAVVKRQLAEVLSLFIAGRPYLQAGRQNIRLNWVTHNQPRIEQRRLEMAQIPVTLR